MWWFIIPKWLKAALGGAVALSVVLGLAWGYVERERRQAVQAERDRIAAQDARDNEATRDRIRDADRSTGDADEDLDWLCRRFGIACVQLVPAPGD